MASPTSPISQEEAMQAILDAGKWSENADEELDLGERLPLGLVKSIIGSDPED